MSTLSETLREDAHAVESAVPNRDHALALALLALSLVYATVRYNVFKGVPWPDWPAYTVNKALAVGSLLLIALSVLRLARRKGRTAILLAWAGALALAHSLLSFALFDPRYYERLFADGKLTFSAGLSITLGVLALAVMELGARKSAGWSPGLRHSALAVTAFGSGLHAALPAVSTWLEPATWPGGLPPLTLISFATGTAALIAWLLASGTQANRKNERA
jgi:hypothetical protein